jgi:DNA-directed RNA polymerase subunit delta
MTSRSMLDVAYDTLKKQSQELSFLDLWNEVVKTMGFTPAQSETKIAQFYSALMLDVRFAPLADNVWDLRSRRTYNETHVDTSTLILEDEYISDEDVEELMSEEEDENTNNDEEEDV